MRHALHLKKDVYIAGIYYILHCSVFALFVLLCTVPGETFGSSVNKLYRGMTQTHLTLYFALLYKILNYFISSFQY